MTNQIQNSKPQKWFHNKTTIILLLIFLHPLGLIGLFLRKETKIWKKIVASIPSFFFFLLILIAILVPAVNNYELAEDEIKKENYLVAYNYLSQVDKSDENYENSQIKLQEIDSLAQKEANNIFSTISENYDQIRQMIDAEKFNDAKTLATKTIKLYEKFKFIYPEAKQDSIYNNLIEIKKYKQNKIKNEVVELTQSQKDSIAKVEQIRQDSIAEIERIENEQIQQAKAQKQQIIKKLKARAKRDWPNDYTTQEYWINEQVDAYEYMLTIENNSIKKQAQRDWPLDFSTQKYWYNEQIEARERLK